jgi:acetyl-CoA carboxylase biotin carboxylase subunit
MISMKVLKKILIANRGEIALRVMRACREMGIATVAVYSDADRNALHVRYADEAVRLGPPPSKESYLLGDKIIAEAKRLNADAIHPGYGFLSENADFADAVQKAGLVLIGPTPDAMRIMGSKLGAKAAVKNYDIPMVPGVNEAIKDIGVAKKVAKEVGFPILIKASAGGGGKGMRVVEREEDFETQMRMAESEAIAAFGDGSVFIEKYVARPRHIEFQVLGDNHGNVVHLFERECSIQRRHQKLVEEAPSSILTPELRARMGKAAVDVAKACNYTGAGTVEFLLDDKLNFYFLEMNTRLQVEHPVTEQITGIDLVKAQIRVAQGEKLWFTQDDLSINGHSIELRVCAEDPANNFLPDIGVLREYRIPQGYGIRVDDGFEQGMEIPIFYDPMIAKLIVHASSRQEAIERMHRAAVDFHIRGIETTLGFGAFVMKEPHFISGDFDTKFIEQYFKPEMLEAKTDEDELNVAAIAVSRVFATKKAQAASLNGKAEENAWTKNRKALR